MDNYEKWLKDKGYYNEVVGETNENYIHVSDVIKQYIEDKEIIENTPQLDKIRTIANNVSYKISEGITFNVYEGSDPEFPGIWVVVQKQDKNGSYYDAGTLHLELEEDDIVTRIWDEEHEGCDPITKLILSHIQEKQ